MYKCRQLAVHYAALLTQTIIDRPGSN